jgi:outer membrane protein OmpA-like peptidoglycan-associated protein
MRSTILALAALAMLVAAAGAQDIPMFGFPMQKDGPENDNYRRVPFRDLGTEIRIDLDANALFDFDHGEVRATARDLMQQIANLIFDRGGTTARIECRSDRTVDRGAPAATQKIAQHCAAAVQDWLVRQEKLTRVRFTTTGVAVQPAPPPNPNDPFAKAAPSRSGITIVFAKR